MRLVRRETELRQRRSGGDALVAMVQASDLGNGDDLTSSWALCRAFHWAIFGKREVCPGSMVVVDVGRENTPQVPLVEDDCIVQTVSADRADDALDVCILPRGSRCRWSIANAHCAKAADECFAIGTIANREQYSPVQPPSRKPPSVVEQSIQPSDLPLPPAT